MRRCRDLTGLADRGRPGLIERALSNGTGMVGKKSGETRKIAGVTSA